MLLEQRRALGVGGVIPIGQYTHVLGVLGGVLAPLAASHECIWTKVADGGNTGVQVLKYLGLRKILNFQTEMLAQGRYY